MEDLSLEFLKELLATPSPSGFESKIQEVIRRFAAPLADEVRIDRHGNLIALKRATPREGQIAGEPPAKVMLAGHCDQLGLMVMHIDETGFLLVQPIGGWDIPILLGQALTVWTVTGPVNAVCSRKAPHLLTPEEKNKLPQFHDIWVDIGAKDRKETESLVQIGDVITCQLGFRPLRNGLAFAPGMDDKVGVWTVFETLRLLKDKPLAVDLYAVSTVQEEIGLRGATTSTYGIQPTVGIAVDVCHATDTPGTEKKQYGEIKLGGGPVIFRGPNINPRVLETLIAAAGENSIPHQIRAAPRATGTDANAIQLSREGVATGLVSLPNRYMHSPVEVVSLSDLQECSRLLAGFCERITPGQSWIP